MTLSTDEFIRRFLTHVLPKGFHRIRHYCLLAAPVRRKKPDPLTPDTGCALRTRYRRRNKREAGTDIRVSKLWGRVTHCRGHQPKDAITIMMRDAHDNNSYSTNQCWRFAVVPGVQTQSYTQSLITLHLRKRLVQALTMLGSNAHRLKTTTPKPHRAKQSP
jgi:hypothetical protein